MNPNIIADGEKALYVMENSDTRDLVMDDLAELGNISIIIICIILKCVVLQRTSLIPDFEIQNRIVLDSIRYNKAGITRRTEDNED